MKNTIGVKRLVFLLTLIFFSTLVKANANTNTNTNANTNANANKNANAKANASTTTVTSVVTNTVEPQTVEQYIDKGRSRAKEGDLEAAVVMYQRALKLEENNGVARKELANILLEAQLNDHYSDQTAAEIAALHEIKPGAPYSPLHFPLHYLSNAAIGSDEQALNYDILLALTQLQKGENESAIKTANTLQKKSPEHPVAYNILGLAWAAKGDAKSAKTSYEKALSLKQDFHAARLNLAELNIRAGDYQKARNDLTEVLKAEKHNRRACLLMAKLSELEGKSEEAKRWYQHTHESY